MKNLSLVYLIIIAVAIAIGLVGYLVASRHLFNEQNLKGQEVVVKDKKIVKDSVLKDASKKKAPWESVDFGSQSGKAPSGF